MTSCKASTFFSQEVFRNCWLQTQEVFSAQKLKLDVSFLGLVFISWVTSKLRNSEEALRLSLLEIAFKVCSVQGESLPLTESLTALWQNYCQDHTYSRTVRRECNLGKQQTTAKHSDEYEILVFFVPLKYSRRGL